MIWLKPLFAAVLICLLSGCSACLTGEESRDDQCGGDSPTQQGIWSFEQNQLVASVMDFGSTKKRSDNQTHLYQLNKDGTDFQQISVTDAHPLYFSETFDYLIAGIPRSRYPGYQQLIRFTLSNGNEEMLLDNSDACQYREILPSLDGVIWAVLSLTGDYSASQNTCENISVSLSMRRFDSLDPLFSVQSQSPTFPFGVWDGNIMFSRAQYFWINEGLVVQYFDKDPTQATLIKIDGSIQDIRFDQVCEKQISTSGPISQLGERARVTGFIGSRQAHVELNMVEPHLLPCNSRITP
jgi:hypothetical protein